MNAFDRLNVFFKRVASSSIKKMYGFAADIHKETGKPTVFILADMGLCILRYGIGYQEYRGYGFVYKTAAQRSTYMTVNNNVALTRMLNDRDEYVILEDKGRFLERFDRYVRRDWLDLRKNSKEEFLEFCGKHPVIFVKPVDSFGGIGVEKFDFSDGTDPEKCYESLISNGQMIVEEQIKQHHEMDRMYSGSVNTIRIVTLLVNGESRHVYSIFRVGSGNGVTDNATSGGIYTWVDGDGTLHLPMYHEKTGIYYDAHPVSGTVIEGFKVPMYEEAVQFCLDAAKEEPGLGYIGWDVAVTEDGPVMVEANILPGNDMAQNIRWREDGLGIKPDFEKALGFTVPK